MRVHILIIVLVGFFFFVFGNWIVSITSPDEGKNLDASLRMIENKDFIAPVYNCKPRFEKPPMFYWLTDISFLTFGVNEFSARLVSGTSAIGTAILTYLLALEFTNPQVAFISALVYIMLPHNWIESKGATPEMLLTFFMVLSLYLLVKEKFTLAWFSMGLAFLTKGPVGVILPSAVYFLWKRSFRFITLKGILVFLITGTFWYILMLLKFGFAYFYKFFLYENILRFTGHKRIHMYPFWYYVPIVLGNFLPYLYAFIRAFRRWDAKLNLFLIWFLFTFIFYSVAKNKLHHYMLFLYPALSVIVARYISLRYVRVILGISAILYLSLLAYVFMFEEERFVPKAVRELKDIKGNVFFYRSESSAVVFYTRRCIENVSDVKEIPENSYVITKKKYLKDFKNYEIIVEGNEFGQKFVLIRVYN